MDFHYDPIPLPHRKDFSDKDALLRAQSYYQDLSTRRTIRDFKSTPIPEEIIEQCLLTAGSAPSGANHQPWHFVAISNQAVKRKIRIAAEKEEQEFYQGKAGDNWLNDLKKIGTDAEKPFLEHAPWLIAIFAERYGKDDEGNKRKNYYISESVGIATGFLISAFHNAGLATLTHTPNPMKFLNVILERPKSERPYILLVVGHPADNALIPQAATIKKPLNAITTFLT